MSADKNHLDEIFNRIFDKETSPCEIVPTELNGPPFSAPTALAFGLNNDIRGGIFSTFSASYRRHPTSGTYEKRDHNSLTATQTLTRLCAEALHPVSQHISLQCRELFITL